MNDEFDQFENYDPKAAEERMRNGGLVAAGKHHATLLGAKKTESKQKGTPGWELTFKITSGAFAGSEVVDTLYVTENPKSRDRLALFGSRLGLLEHRPDGKGLQKVTGKTDLMDCLDTAVVIEVIHEPDQKDPNRKWVRLAFGGIYRPDDPELKKEAGKKSAPSLPGTGSAASASPPPPAATAGGGKPKVARGAL